MPPTPPAFNRPLWKGSVDGGSTGSYQVLAAARPQTHAVRSTVGDGHSRSRTVSLASATSLGSWIVGHRDHDASSDRQEKARPQARHGSLRGASGRLGFGAHRRSVSYGGGLSSLALAPTRSILSPVAGSPTRPDEALPMHPLDRSRSTPPWIAGTPPPSATSSPVLVPVSIPKGPNAAEKIGERTCAPTETEDAPAQKPKARRKRSGSVGTLLNAFAFVKDKDKPRGGAPASREASTSPVPAPAQQTLATVSAQPKGHVTHKLSSSTLLGDREKRQRTLGSDLDLCPPSPLSPGVHRFSRRRGSADAPPSSSYIAKHRTAPAGGLFSHLSGFRLRDSPTPPPRPPNEPGSFMDRRTSVDGPNGGIGRRASLGVGSSSAQPGVTASVSVNGDVRPPQQGAWLLGVWHGPPGVSPLPARWDPPTLPDEHAFSPAPAAKHREPELDSRLEVAACSPKPYPRSTDRNAVEAADIPQVKIISVTDFGHSPERAMGPSGASVGPEVTVSHTHGAKGLDPARVQAHSGTGSPTWVVELQNDFSTRIWCSYRSHFAPIARDGQISRAAAEAAEVDPGQVEDWSTARDVEDLSLSSGGWAERLGAPVAGLWSRAVAAAQSAGLARGGITTDAGWGCMLRTGQSVLVNALLLAALGREWRRPVRPPPSGHPEEQRAYAQYVRVVSSMMDSPSARVPYSIHRFAQQGVLLGKAPGEWFGPSTAAGAILRCVAEPHPHASLNGPTTEGLPPLAVVLAYDSTLHTHQVLAAGTSRAWPAHDNDPYAAPNPLHRPQPSRPEKSRRPTSASPPAPFRRAVLLLAGLRFGIDKVHESYYESIKVCGACLLYAVTDILFYRPLLLSLRRLALPAASLHRPITL